MRTLRLPDGRRLAYADWGDPGAAPVIYLHGAFGAPLQATAGLAATLRDGTARVVCPMRPGFGGSDPQPRRRILDWPADVAALADRLEIGRFSVLGVSTGAPYAAACALALHGRVLATGLVSAFVPGPTPVRTARLALLAARRAPRPTTALLDAAASVVRRRPGVLLRGMAALSSAAADGDYLRDPAARAGVTVAFRAASAGGMRAMVDDSALVSAAWGFAPGQVRGPVQVWHGARDGLVPVALARRLAAELPGGHAVIDPVAGHFFFRARMAEILAALVPAGGPAALTPRRVAPAAGA